MSCKNSIPGAKYGQVFEKSRLMRLFFRTYFWKASCVHFGKKVAATAKKAAAAPAKAKAAVKATVKKAEDKAVADKIETKKTARKAAATVKTAVKNTEKKVEKKVNQVKAAKLEIIVQSPMGGNITADEIAAKVPAGSESVFVRVDQNKLWWIKGEETGSVDIW